MYLFITLFSYCKPGFTAPPILMVNFIKDITSSSLVVQWNAVDDVIHYVLTWSGGGFVVTRLTSYTITGLTVDTTYTITVSSANRCGDGPVFTISILFFPDTTSTTIISPTVTTSTNPMTIVSTVIPITTTTASASKFFKHKCKVC